MTGRLTSPSNPHLKRARRLRQRKHREREGAFVVEGIHPVWRAAETGADVQVVLMAPAVLTSEAARQLVAGLSPRGTRVLEVDAESFASVSERDNPSGLAAVVRSKQTTLDDLEVSAQSVFVALVDVANPGNLGTIVRTADAAAAAGVLLMGESTDAFHPAAVKASMGALFSVPLCHTTFDDLSAWRQAQGASLVTTSARADGDLWEADIPLPCIVLFGSEARGLPRDVLEQGDVALRIPMWGSTTSLNLAVAAGVVIYEIKRRAGR